MTTMQKQRHASKRPLNAVLTSFVVAGFSSAALGNPQNHTLVEGNTPVLTTNGSELSIATNGRTILNWDSFSIGTGELTRFVMSGADQAVLNRVTGGLHSQIDGRLESNGRVYLINPNGVIVGATGMVQTQSFIASTRYLADEDFMDGGDLTFLGTGSSEVHNLGTIQAADGDVALIGSRVINSGVITAPQGIIALAAGDEVMLAAPGSERLLVRVDGVATGQGALVNQTGVLSAAQAELQAVGGYMYGLAVNAGGQINATGVANRDGRIYLTTNVGEIDVPGTLSARNSDGSGGSVHISAGVGFGSAVLVNGTVDAASTSTGGGIYIGSSRIELNDGAHLLVSGGTGNAGGVFIGSEESTDYLSVAEGASIEANSTAGDAGNVDLTGAGVYFHGQLQARGAGTQATFNIHSGEGVEYTGLADLRAYGNDARFGTVNIDSAYANLTIAMTGTNYPGIIDVDALATQLNYGNVKIAANGTDRYIDVFAPVTWQSPTRLTLQASDNVDLNESIEASNGALHLISLNGGISDLEPATITVRDLWLSAADGVNLANRVIAQNVTLYDVGGHSWLTNEQNQLGTVTFVRDLRARSGNVDIVDSAGGLSLTTNNVGGITYSTDGNFRLRTAGDLTLSSGFQTQVDGDVTLVATGGVLRNQSVAGANVFGTSSTGLGRTRVYAASVGDNGGLEGPAHYNVSYSAQHAETAGTGFYYSANAPQGPDSSDPDPVEPEHPVDPPHVPELPPLPRSQLIQNALSGNSFEQLNRPAQEVVSRLPVVQPTPPSPAAPNGLTLTSSMIDQLQRMAQLAEGEAGTTKQKNPDGDRPSREPQPPQQIVEQMDAMIMQVLAFLQQMQGTGAGANPEQLMKQLNSVPEGVQQLLNQFPAMFQQQLAIIMTQYAMNQRQEALDARNQQLQQQLDQLNQAAQQLRDAAAQRMAAAIISGITQIAGASMSFASNPPVLHGLPTPTPPSGQLPLTPPAPPPPLKNIPQPNPAQSGMFQAPPQPGAQPPPVLAPVPPPIPSAVQAQMDAIRNNLQPVRSPRAGT